MCIPSQIIGDSDPKILDIDWTFSRTGPSRVFEAWIISNHFLVICTILHLTGLNLIPPFLAHITAYTNPGKYNPMVCQALRPLSKHTYRRVFQRVGGVLNIVTRNLVGFQNSLLEPSYEIMVLFVLRKLSLQTRMRSPGARCLIFGRTLCRTVCLFSYFMWANSDGSGETARMRRLARAFAGRQCDK